MSKNLSAKYYQENKGYFQKYFLQKKTCKRYKNLSKEEKKKQQKISLKMKNINWLSVDKNIIK